jgi:hypothetical protein
MLQILIRTVNHGLQALFQCHHPTMWTFLDGVLRDMNKQKALLLQGATGVAHPPTKKYAKLQQRVQQAVASYGATEVLVFLRAMAHLSHA